MKRFSTSMVILSVIMVILFGLVVSAQSDPVIAKADKFINALKSGDYNAAYTMLNADLGFTITADDLNKSWNTLVSKAGKLEEVKKKTVKMENGYFIVTEVVKFENGHVDLIVALDNSMGVADFVYKNHVEPESTGKPADSASGQQDNSGAPNQNASAGTSSAGGSTNEG